jgi:hypothetical protein
MTVGRNFGGGRVTSSEPNPSGVDWSVVFLGTRIPMLLEEKFGLFQPNRINGK